MNEEKRALSGQLIAQIKFVRELQSQLGTADNGHVTEVIDKDLEEQFRREKHLNIQLKERLKQCEVEKFQIIEQLRELEAQKNVTVVARNEGTQGDLRQSMMGVEEMLRYRQTIMHNLDDVVRDLDVLRLDDEAAARAVDHLRA